MVTEGGKKALVSEWVVTEGGKKALVSFAHSCFFIALGDHPFAHSCFFIALCDHPWNLFYNIQFVMKFLIALLYCRQIANINPLYQTSRCQMSGYQMMGSRYFVPRHLVLAPQWVFVLNVITQQSFDNF